MANLVATADLEPLPPAPKEERRYLGAASIPTVYEAFKPHVATLPTGERVELPAGTVLREGVIEPTAEDKALERLWIGDLTERAGLPREMAPSVKPLPIAEAFRLGMHIGLEPLHTPERKQRT